MLVDLNEIIQIKWTKCNKKYFESKGYIFTKYNDLFNIKIKDLNSNNHIKVPCTCDYCGKELNKEYFAINPSRDVEYKSQLKICCKQCGSKKQKDICLEKGYEWTSQIPGSREKCSKTWHERYDNTPEGKLVQEKINNTLMERYGVKYAAQNAEIYNKVIQTNIKKYGTKYTVQSDIVKNKIQQIKSNKTNEEKIIIEEKIQICKNMVWNMVYNQKLLKTK